MMCEDVENYGHPHFFIFMDRSPKDIKRSRETEKRFNASVCRDRFLFWNKNAATLVHYFEKIMAKYLA